MNAKKQPEFEPAEPQDAVSAPAEEWVRLFIKHLELNALDAIRDLSSDATDFELRTAMARAILATYVDSGMDVESALEAFGQATVERETPTPAWTEALNQRRFELIDKKIQAELTVAESIELARLTSLMRNHIDSDENLPMKGAQALHRRLLHSDSTSEHG